MITRKGVSRNHKILADFEETAGDEWDVDSSAELVGMGWVQAEGEECLYYFTTPDGERHELIRVVDDYLILICDGEGNALAAATMPLN